MCFAVLKYRKKIDFILIDTFSTSNFYFALLTSQIARLYNLKYIPILHGGNLPYRLNNSKYLSKLIFSNSYKNIAPSNYLKYEFEKRNYKTEFIPNVIEIDQYKFKKRRVLKPNLLFVRAFDKIYNPTMAIKVLYEIKKDFPDAKLCMIGPVKDDSFKVCKQLATDLNIIKDIEFTGVLSKEEWHKISENYDVFINTTNFDNTPVSVLEAMALGLPVVSTNAGGLPYLINDGFDGVLVDKNDVNSMSKYIIELIKNSTKAVNLAINARKKVEKFDWKYVKQQWKNILNA
jgi:glycosyltransferase involved in cell wall biosynthesis